ncbi:drug/metabolite transporter (DMT)-like permease [Allocatelliglobosispora scoriae]|uniref:Drug/metabolite transporter (DMT)-like permease n=1 Tax=Allocatelliglobosispora scoriae TaxID=643052 RepID=A0A841BS11_9ACTN|nr:DMT family transporter [Allocatelliglobosispora scoriae]MBB5870495.1 drug/metabolite transporter (DMT)-like permease [Allocatelliglobosispora scoriae]
MPEKPVAISPATITALVVAITTVSSSGPLIAYAAAPALVLAFWRNALATGLLIPFAALRRREELARLWRDGELRWSVLAGFALAAHFATWMSAAQLTSVATATALVCSQPAWAGLIAFCRGQKLGVATWIGIGLAVIGAVIATGADVRLGHDAILGDILALAGGLFAAVYTTLGERARQQSSTASYTTVCYAVCAVLLGVACLATGSPLMGFTAQTWLAIIGLTLGAQLLGHSMLNFALREVSATMIGVLVLLEVPGAALMAWLWLDQVPPAAAWPGVALVVAGVAVVILGNGRRQPREAPAEL